MKLSALTSAPPVKPKEQRDNIPAMQVGNFPHYDVEGFRVWQYPVYAVQVRRDGRPPIIAACRANVLMFAGLCGVLRWRPVAGAPATHEEVRVKPKPIAPGEVQAAPWERED